MKAEHRKELQTNALADHVGRFIKGAKSSSGSIWLVLALLVLAPLAYWWWTTRSANRISAAWVDYWHNRDSATDAAAAAEREEGTSAARAARLTEADQLFERGFNALFTKSPEEVQSSLTRATGIYESLAKNSGNSRMLALRALSGAAKCQETLGKLDRAKSLYGEIATRFKDMPAEPLVKDAADRLAQLNKPGTASFYTDWLGESRFPKTTIDKPLDLPPLPAETQPPAKP